MDKIKYFIKLKFLTFIMSSVSRTMSGDKEIQISDATRFLSAPRLVFIASQFQFQNKIVSFSLHLNSRSKTIFNYPFNNAKLLHHPIWFR